ncbi:MAG: TonB-dependent receptor [Rhodothermales bacterium]|nr:TonB-dependent receptor [Rhodothermales bacterium]
MLALWQGLLPVAAAQTSEPRKLPVAKADSIWTLSMPAVVITATRSIRELRDVPILTDVVTSESMRLLGAPRLSEVLAEQTGLAIVPEFGAAGVQLQGMDAAYTLVLIDGEPVIGRSGGAVDLERIGVAGVERVEIVRGPLSSLYGSEALAGVINVITRTPQEGVQGSARASFETHDTMDLTVASDLQFGRFGSRIELNRFSSSGYDLFPEILGLTVPGFTDYAANARLRFDGDHTEWRLNGRFATQEQQSSSGLFLNGIQVEFDERAERTDWSLAPHVTHRLRSGDRLTGRLYAASYGTFLSVRDLADTALATTTLFDQAYYKAEAQWDAVLSRNHFFSAGAGYIGETVQTDRVRGGKRSNENLYGFLQHEWMPGDKVDVVLSTRLDRHSDYGLHLSPRLALLVTPREAVRVRMSVGSGFKAPTFQQLYMDFTNPAGGYTVFGSVDIRQALDEQAALGLIDYLLADPSEIGGVRPETALAYTLGVDAELGPRTYLQTHLFRSDVRDQIETLPAAVRTNGQTIFTYVNLNEVFVQGFHAELRHGITPALEATLGYQFLDARDRDVLDQIDAGELFTRVDGRDRRLTRSDYGGLFSRSRHSGNLRVLYRWPEAGLTASVRGILRGRYGYADLNGNLVLDDDREYVEAYTLWNATLTKRLGPSVEAQLGAKNLFDVTDREYVPSLSGRRWFVSLQYTFDPKR